MSNPLTADWKLDYQNSVVEAGLTRPYFQRSVTAVAARGQSPLTAQRRTDYEVAGRGFLETVEVEKFKLLLARLQDARANLEAAKQREADALDDYTGAAAIGAGEADDAESVLLTEREAVKRATEQVAVREPEVAKAWSEVERVYAKCSRVSEESKMAEFKEHRRALEEIPLDQITVAEYLTRLEELKAEQRRISTPMPPLAQLLPKPDVDPPEHKPVAMTAEGPLPIKDNRFPFRGEPTRADPPDGEPRPKTLPHMMQPVGLDKAKR